ncbi:MAG: hypothetical protein JKP90_20635 [Desulfofustis sp. PB-SRB1]|nr:hypothetical protein [Desulfofustis sp. PB-SRB1]
MSILDVWIVRVGNVIGWLYFAAVVISVFEVVLRYGFNRPTLLGTRDNFDAGGIGMLWGGSYCMAEDRHIRVTVIRDAHGQKNEADRRCYRRSAQSALLRRGLPGQGMLMTQKALFDPTGMFRLQRTGSAFNSPAPAVVKTVLFVVVILMTLQARAAAGSQDKGSKRPSNGTILPMTSREVDDV